MASDNGGGVYIRYNSTNFNGIYPRKGSSIMKYLVTGEYANGDKYFDKFDTLQEIAEHIKFLYSTDNARQPDENRLTYNGFTVEIEE